MRLKELTEEEIFERKEMYLTRLNYLMRNISDYFETHDWALGYRISEEYRAIKEEIRDEAKYLDCKKNDISDISKTHQAYSKGIRGARAFGLTVRSNGKVDHRMFSAVEEAHYRLNKFF